MKGRWLETPLARVLARPDVHVLFGARQTGKSTLLGTLVRDADLWIALSNPGQRARFLAERPAQNRRGYLVCRCDRPRRRTDEVLAVPWWAL